MAIACSKKLAMGLMNRDEERVRAGWEYTRVRIIMNAQMNIELA
jgi:hypothetical protein